MLKRETENDSQFYTASSSMECSISEELLCTYLAKEGKWESFEEFTKYNYGIWTVKLNRNDIHDSNCTCPHFLKHTSCKHTLGMQIRLKLVIPPAEAKPAPLGPKRKRGRPTKAKCALLIN